MHVDTPPSRRVRGISRAEYERIAELGIFDGQRVELLYGAIVEMSPIGPEHGDSVDRLNEWLVSALRGRARIRVQGAFAASDDSEPEPDVTMVPPGGDYGAENPRIAWLIIEVAKPSLADDRDKAVLYASSEVDEYWIVNLIDDVVEVHRDPGAGRYRSVQTIGRGGMLRVSHFPDVAIFVDEILPRA